MRLDTNFSDVCAFHDKFNVPVRTTPQTLAPDESEFRIKFLREELEEYEQAVSDGNLVKQFDALIDLIYVAYGTMALHGFDADLGHAIVHAANMKKQRAASAAESLTETGRSHSLDVIKPKGWQSPEPMLAFLLALHQVPIDSRVRSRIERTALEWFIPSYYGPEEA